jgi:tripeptide aminopeptidase
MNQEPIKNRIDVKALTSVLSVQTKTFHDENMIAYIRNELKSMDVTVQEDNYGNIYVIKGKAKTYTCIVAHTDTVHDILPNITIYRSNDTIFAFDPVNRTQFGIGGDDKVGVYITLQLLKDLPVMKAVFFRDEECGCRGSSYSILNHKEWYEDCGFVMMSDRRGNSDIITVSAGIIIASQEFLETCDPIFDKYNYKDAIGICTDVDILTLNGIGISTVNFSSGYHSPHSSREIVSITDVNRCYNLMYDILVEHGDKTFKYEASIPAYKSSYLKTNNVSRNSYIDEITKAGGISSPVGKRQLKLFGPFLTGDNPGVFDIFTERDVLKGKQRIYAYTGVKALTLTGEDDCPMCKLPVIENVYFLPYEGRMFCTKCNDYIRDDKVPALLKLLEVENKETTFVYSLYSAGWLKKDFSVWNDKISSWMSDGLPF